MTKNLMNAPETYLEARSLCARRGESVIFSDLSFCVKAGSALLLTGANGSGKSTLLRIVAGLLQAEKGCVSLMNSPHEARPLHTYCHYFGHRNAMKAELTVRENLEFWHDFCCDPTFGSGLSPDEAASAVGLAAIMHLPFGYLSAGQQRRLAFAKLLLSPRPIWLLDEPTTALDHAADQLIVSLANQHLHRGGMVLAATHQPFALHNSQTLRLSDFAATDTSIWL